MEFTLKEKKACIFILMALADCDGRRNMEEIEMLERCSTVLGITIDEMLGGLLESASFMSKTEIESIVKPMDKLKKSLLEDCMAKIMKADGPANETEIGVWWTIQMSYDLPEWVSRKND